MSWKNTVPFFAWQTLRYARNGAQFRRLWSYRQRWSNSFRPGRNSVADELPWINFPALEFLEQHLRPEYKVFEFGGGGSTLFFCRNVAEVATVEDHPEWFDILTRTVREKGYRNWKGFLIPAEELKSALSPRSPQDPAAFASGAKGMENMSFEKYARAIDAYPDDYFDVIVVDGRSRPSCIQQALPHLKTGGILVVDNTERPYYLAAFQQVITERFRIEVNEYAPVAYTPGFTRTTIMRRMK